jgi:hypothetical protein
LRAKSKKTQLRRRKKKKKKKKGAEGAATGAGSRIFLAPEAPLTAPKAPNFFLARIGAEGADLF